MMPPGDRVRRGRAGNEIPSARPLSRRSPLFVQDHEVQAWIGNAVSAFTGRVNCNVAPWGTFAVAHSRPPWASTIERQIESPIPMPLGLVVKKALNSRSALLAEIPTPVSVTVTRTR